jgi:hypothetical protein
MIPILTYVFSCRRIRRAAHEALTKRAVQRYHPIQAKEATILTLSLLTPSINLNPDKQFQRLSASTIVSILYDHSTIVSEHDKTLEKIDAYNLRLSKAEMPGSYFVDIFPWMVHIPERSWFRFRFLVVDTDTRPNKIREMEEGRLKTIYRGLCHVQGPSQSCSS